MKLENPHSIEVAPTTLTLILILIYIVLLCLSVSLSVSMSQVDVLSKRLNLGSNKQHHWIAQEVYFSDNRNLREIRQNVVPCGVSKCRCGGSK